MKNAKRIGNIGRLLMIIGSALYVASMLTSETNATVIALCCLYIAAMVLMFIGWLGTRDERKAAREAKKAEKAEKKK